MSRGQKLASLLGGGALAVAVLWLGGGWGLLLLMGGIALLWIGVGLGWHLRGLEAAQEPEQRVDRPAVRLVHPPVEVADWRAKGWDR